MTRKIRNGTFGTGLVLANGGVLSYQHAICLSARPNSIKAPYYDSRQKSDNIVKGFSSPIDSFAEGEAFIEVRIGL